MEGGLRILFLVGALLLSTFALAGKTDPTSSLKARIGSELNKRYPASTIVIDSMTNYQKFAATAKIRLIAEQGRGTALFSVESGDTEGRVRVVFRAMRTAWVALRRIRPLERLSQNLFIQKEIDVSKGINRQIRSLLVAPHVNISGLQSQQTILLDHPLMTNAAVKVPDVKRGDVVRVVLKSGALSLTTMGKVQQAGYVGGSITILTVKNKREFVGNLTPGKVVEVQL